MTNEIFRFVNLRQPRSTDGKPADKTGIELQRSDEPTPLRRELVQLKRTLQPRSHFEAAAQRYIASDQYALGARSLPIRIDPLDEWLHAQGIRVSKGDVLEAVKTTLHKPLDQILRSEEYRSTRIRLSDSLLALSILPTSPADKNLLTRWMRIAGLLERVSTGRTDAIEKDRVMSAPILLPGDIFPLPSTENPHNETMKKAAEEERKRHKSAQETTAQLAGRIQQLRQALSELATALRTDSNDLRRTFSTTYHDNLQPVTARGSSAARPARSRRLSMPVLSTKSAKALSATTKAVLQSSGVSEDFIDVSYVAKAIETEIADASATLFNGGSYRTIARIGNQWVPTVNLNDLVLDTGAGWKTPGPCSQPVSESPIKDQPTVPAITKSAIRPVGIADLLQVRQKIKRYALGEIAHIENIMLGESKERTHRQSTRVTETVVVETERTKEDSRDLQTAERFELQQEMNEVIQEESSREVGLSFSASYGPFQGTANITFSHADSREESNKSATRYSREVTDKAVKKIQERILERRSTTTEKEVEEINKHGFDNRDNQQHVQGVYRWVDKIYEAQVVSYGLRTIFEFVVPEPAAFYKHASSVTPRESSKFECPIPPGYCHHPGGTFVPLLPSDLHEGNYQFWVSQYGVTGIEPPPPLYKTIGIPFAAKSSDTDRFVMITNNELQVPGGYQAERAFVSGVFFDVKDSDQPNDFFNFHVGRTFLTVNSSGPMNGEDGVIPVVGHGDTTTGATATIEVLCLRTKEAYDVWQLATYNAIIATYNDLKSQYENALARREADIQNGVAIGGRNPGLNRDVERNELKRASLSVLTGQHFDDFDAMRRRVPPHGYPQMDLAETEAEAGYIQFFEQAFEWVNMGYIFYPYFWGRKADWPAYLRLDDTDPMFAKFLQAGAARVQVPVRPGFEQAVLYLLQTGNRPWEEDDHAFHIEGSLYVSMVDEIKEEQMGAFTKGVGSIAVQTGSPTITGTKTAFDEKLHTDRDISILERTYHVRQVISATALVLDRPYQDAPATDVPYSFGARLVGDPWELRVPTSLVFLQEGNDLPDLSND